MDNIYGWLISRAIMLGIAVLIIALVLGCDVPPSDGGGPMIAISYDADFYTCGEPPDDVLFTCRVGTGPPRQDCVANGSGTTTTAPITC